MGGGGGLKWLTLWLSRICLIFLFDSLQMPRKKMIGFWEDVAPNLENDEFRRYFRMNKETLLSLCDYLQPKQRNYHGGREQITARKCVAVTVCFLGCQLPFKQLRGFFGISESCLINVTDYIMELLNQKSSSIIKWPAKDEFESIAAEFNKKRTRSVCCNKTNT